jgi:hypothetical protein
MKNILLLLAASALMFSCQKEEIEPNQEQEQAYKDMHTYEVKIIDTDNSSNIIYSASVKYYDEEGVYQELNYGIGDINNSEYSLDLDELKSFQLFFEARTYSTTVNGWAPDYTTDWAIIRDGDTLEILENSNTFNY